jgi:hypothetical protein
VDIEHDLRSGYTVCRKAHYYPDVYIGVGACLYGVPELMALRHGPVQDDCVYVIWEDGVAGFPDDAEGLEKAVRLAAAKGRHMTINNLAPGVEFFEKRHEYYYQGRKLSGVTGLIAKKLKMKLPDEFMGEHRDEGIHIHRAIQDWILTGSTESLHPGVQWITGTLRSELGSGPFFSEVLISDFEKYASAVDIIAPTLPPLKTHLAICDIKKGVFHRDYVSWQLGIYKYLIEQNTDCTVDKCVCICVRDREYYPIIPVDAEKVEQLLYGDRT